MDINSDDSPNKEIDGLFDGEEIVSKDVSDFPALLSDQQQLVTSADHEIVVELNMNVISRNPSDPAAPPETKGMYNNNYWIPIPSGKNIDHYILSFIDHFEKSMTNSIDRT